MLKFVIWVMSVVSLFSTSGACAVTIGMDDVCRAAIATMRFVPVSEVRIDRQEGVVFRISLTDQFGEPDTALCRIVDGKLTVASEDGYWNGDRFFGPSVRFQLSEDQQSVQIVIGTTDGTVVEDTYRLEDF